MSITHNNKLEFRRVSEEKSVSNSEISHPEYRDSHIVTASREMTYYNLVRNSIDLLKTILLQTPCNNWHSGRR